MDYRRIALIASACALAPYAAHAQESAPPAGGSKLPEVEVIQKKAPVQKAAPAKKKTVAKKAPAPQPAPPPEEAPPAEETQGIASGTVQMSPLAGSELPIGKVPNAVGRASASDIARTGEVQATDVLQRTVPGVILSDAQGNVFQRTLQYRGYDASPLNGDAQGLAVYQNGVRINESFGDIVNWDFIPSNAIQDITIEGANPVFGLNAIGGAAIINMRDGFNFHGVELDTRAGSFGRIQGSVAAGAQSGPWAAFIAGERISDDGFRDFSEAEIKRIYADLGVKSDGKEFHLNFTGAKNHVGVTAAAPEELLDLGWERTFTSPQTTDNELAMISLNGSVKATNTLTFSGLAYYRKFKQKHEDGNISEVEPCAGDPSELCVTDDGETEEIEFAGDEPDFDDDTIFGSIDRTSQDADSYGLSVQAVEKSPLFGFGNQFLIGASFDHGRVKYAAGSELGYFGPKFVVHSFDPPAFVEGPDDFVPRALTTTNDYVGLYFSDTIDLTSRLAVTFGGRYNYAHLKLDNTGFEPDDECDEEPDEEGCEDKISGKHTFERFNPTVGATYKLAPGLTLYGSYAEANRAPTAAELSCADPENPCLIESFLTADPPLDQVVSKTFELGLRGDLVSLSQTQKLEWTLGLFHATNEDDIIPIANGAGRGYFQNAGETRRQGVEAGVAYHDTRFAAYANYSYVDATFQSSLLLPSPDNPNEDNLVDCGEGEEECIQVRSGDRLPGVPRHRFKTGFDYWITPKWRFGADLIAASDQVFFGDESNQNRTLAGYAKIDLHTSYDVTENIQIYGLIDNLFDTRYGLFGNYFNVDAANSAAQADGLGDDFFEEGKNRTITPAPPFAAYGGVKVRF